MLNDLHHRRFTYLRLSVTEKCNYRCNYCLPDGYCKPDDKPEELKLDEIKKIVAAFAANGTRKIRITGGEPTLRKDLAQIIAICKTTPGIEQVALTSNAYRIEEKLPAYVRAGLDRLNLSADSLNPQTFNLITGHNRLNDVIRAIDLAEQLGMAPVKVNTVLLKQYNAGELKQFLGFVKHRPVTVRFIELMQTGDNQKFFAAQHLTGEHIQQTLIREGWQLLEKQAHSGPAREYRHPGYAGGVGLIMPYSKDFCADCNRLRVSSEGRLHLCLFADDSQALRPYLRHTPEVLATRLRELVLGKQSQHHLHQAHTGAIQHLAMIGG